MYRFEEHSILSGLGISQTGRRLPRLQFDLAIDACLEAISDAGLTPAGIDGLAMLDYYDVPAADVCEGLGLELDWSGGTNAGGHLGVVINAMMAVATGICRHVLIYRSVNMLAGVLPTGPAGHPEGPWAWQIPYHDYAAATNFALYARRHMHLYGTTKEQLGWIAITCRYHAGLNDAAVLREPLTMAAYLNGRIISEPLNLFDCDVPIDGAAAFVVSAADYAPDCPTTAIRFEAIGCARHDRLSWDQRAAYPAMAAVEASEQMWNRTDLQPVDVDTAQLYDGFSFTALSWIEALGFCQTGEGGPFVEGGARIRLGGELPLNTYGGQLSAGRLHGFWLLHEAVLQLRREAGARQVENAEVAVISAGAGPACGSILLTR